MDNFTVEISITAAPFNEEIRIMIRIKVTMILGKFARRAYQQFVKVKDTTQSVTSFMCNMSPNQKELNGYFATDALASFTGAADVEFGFGPEVTGYVPVPSIQASIKPLPPILSGTSLPEANNAWLQSITQP
ncbi:MAG: hypothetical protein WKF87_11975 [Chryseolinea sp.]